MRKSIQWKNLCTAICSLIFILPHISWAFDTAVYSVSNLISPGIRCAGKIISIPREIGAITNTFQGQDKTVVLISDLHCNYEVQKNIASIIGKLADNHQVRFITEEGAFNRVDLDVLRTFPIANLREAVTDYYVKQGRITGAEYYTATGSQAVSLEGVEDPTLYQKSFHAIRSFLNAENLGYCADLRDALDDLKSEVYNRNLLKHDSKTKAYRQGTLPLLQYALYLVHRAEPLSLPADSCPQPGHQGNLISASHLQESMLY